MQDLLYRKLAIDITDQEFDRDYDLPLREVHIVFPEIDVRESELAGAGLRCLPAEG